MQTIRIQPIPHQTLKCRIDDQYFSLALYQKGGQIFADVARAGEWLVRMVPCLRLVPIVCREYAGMRGQFLFVDTEGSADPDDYSGLGTRWQLLYLDADEYAAVQELHLQ